MTDDVNAFLMGMGGRSASFRNVNDRVWGDVLASEVRQQTEFGSGEPLFWKDGKPRLQLVITLQTDEQDDDEDDGVRKVYAKGNMLNAVRQAIVKAGAKGIEDGGKLLIQYVGDGESKQRGNNPPKLYFAKYQPPVRRTDLPDESNDYELSPEQEMAVNESLPF